MFYKDLHHLYQKICPPIPDDSDEKENMYKIPEFLEKVIDAPNIEIDIL